MQPSCRCMAHQHQCDVQRYPASYPGKSSQGRVGLRDLTQLHVHWLARKKRVLPSRLAGRVSDSLGGRPISRGPHMERVVTHLATSIASGRFSEGSSEKRVERTRFQLLFRKWFFFKVRYSGDPRRTRKHLLEVPSATRTQSCAASYIAERAGERYRHDRQLIASRQMRRRLRRQSRGARQQESAGGFAKRE